VRQRADVVRLATRRRVERGAIENQRALPFMRRPLDDARVEFAQVRIEVIQALSHLVKWKSGNLEMWEFGNVNLESPDCRVRGPGLEETPGPQLAAVAVAARLSFRRRIVAAQRQAVVGAEGKAAADDVGLREAEERREHFERAPFDAGSRREGRDLLERAKVFRAAGRVTGETGGVEPRAEGFGGGQRGPGH